MEFELRRTMIGLILFSIPFLVLIEDSLACHLVGPPTLGSPANNSIAPGTTASFSWSGFNTNFYRINIVGRRNDTAQTQSGQYSSSIFPDKGDVYQ